MVESRINIPLFYSKNQLNARHPSKPEPRKRLRKDRLSLYRASIPA